MTGNKSRMKRCIAIAVVASALAAVPAALGGAKSSADTGSLNLEAELAMTSTRGPCPPDAPPAATLCATRTGSGLVRGLGSVTESYTFFVQENGCGDSHRVLETTARLEIAGKGALRLALDRPQGCIPNALVVSRAFTITGGSGIYTGASGSGIVNSQAHQTFTGAAGTDTWTGTLTVPGLEFDVTPPTLSGTVNRTVRARRRSKRARVTYNVTAVDEADGSVPVSCRPRSGSRFRMGRTVVKCSATDASGNMQTGRFRITVKPHR
jgi:hypothetical protein